MRKVNLILGFILLHVLAFSQTFVGTSNDPVHAYNCTFKIHKDSAIHFIYNTKHNGIYGEYNGSITQINDTLFGVSATLAIGQFEMKSFNKDTFYIQMDSTVAKQLNVIEMEYSDRKTRKQLQGYDRLGKPIRILKIPINKTLFNSNKGTNIISITINRKNFLSEKFLCFKISYGSAASFKSGQVLNFNVVIKNGQLVTSGEPPLQTGHFRLKVMKD